MTFTVREGYLPQIKRINRKEHVGRGYSKIETTIELIDGQIIGQNELEKTLGKPTGLIKYVPFNEDLL